MACYVPQGPGDVENHPQLPTTAADWWHLTRYDRRTVAHDERSPEPSCTASKPVAWWLTWGFMGVVTLPGSTR